MWDVVHLWVVMAKLCVTGNVLICYNADLFSAFDHNYVLLLQYVWSFCWFCCLLLIYFLLNWLYLSIWGQLHLSILNHDCVWVFCLHDDKVPFFFCFRIIHLVFTLTFHFFVLRHVEKYLGWLRTALIYLGSGIGGNIVSAVFVPYNPEVRLSRETVWL